MNEPERASTGGNQPLAVAAVRERGPGERRVALVPAVVDKLRALGAEVLIEAGAGAAAHFPDRAYAEAGAAVLPTDELYRRADVLVSVGRPDGTDRLRAGQAVVGLLAPLTDPGYVGRLATLGVTAISLDGLPRLLSRAQSMDVLSSQASVAGYRAAVLAADLYGRYFPLLITAAGTERPAEVLVLGVGVAGLQALGTARRLGALVRAYDVRPEARAEAESVGATFLDLRSVAAAGGAGGYARALTPDEQRAQQLELSRHIARHDIVITTAQVPGRRPPVLVTADALGAMRPGSVVLDLAASDLGGNVEGSRPDETLLTASGVTVVGAGNLAATMPTGASAAYARNIAALLAHLVVDGALAIDRTDEIQAGVVIAHGGRVVHPGTIRLLEATAPAGANPALATTAPGADR
ncbi:MAG TPA: NAD(P) transhydrogenase subunit alpha [Mycobacteriales bacterium]|nr:NAD(P) transhydrogenase subunit alpha [Mycobacteriales bacterium]